MDEVRDEKLRSRTAALALVGIGLQDLGINFDRRLSESDDVQIEDWISKARDGLLRMNDAKYPLGKLQQLVNNLFLTIISLFIVFWEPETFSAF